MAPAAGLGRAHDTLLPQPPGGNAQGALLALLVHAGLVAALTVSVDWRMRPPEVVSAELWASVPQTAAPAPTAAPEPAPPPAPSPPAPAPTPAPAPPVQTAPPPAEPDIALQRAEKRKAEEARRKAEAAAEDAKRKALAAAEEERRQARAEAERRRLAEAKQRAADEKTRREQAAQAAREAKAEEDRLAKLREENLRRMMAQAGGVAGATGPATSTGTAAQSAAPSRAYTGRLIALIRGNLVFPGEMPADNHAAEVEVTAAASGTIIARRLVKSSGHKDWDEAVLRAIDRTPALPRDVDGRVPSRLLIAFRPRE